MSRRGEVLLGILAATIVLGATALPSLASTKSKIFTLNVTPTGVVAGTQETTPSLTATFKNVSPNGTGSINSLTLTATGGPANFVIIGATPQSGHYSISNGKTLTITNMSPVNSGATFVVGLTVSVPPATACGSSTVTWNAIPWNGSAPGAGSTFSLVQPSSITTTISPSGSPSQLTFDGPNGAQPALYNVIGEFVKNSVGGPVEVYVTDSCSDPVADGTNVTISIGTDPTGVATLNGVHLGTETQTTSSGVATFADVAVAPTSSGYTLHAAAGSAAADSDTFDVTNTLPACTTDCTATFPNGTSTVTAPSGTVLIIETNQLQCSAVQNPIAGTVTIIPPNDTDPIAATFEDKIPLPVAGPYPFCKTPPDPPAAVPLCNTIQDGFDQPGGSEACLKESVEFTGDPDFATLHSILYLNAGDPRPAH
jgi:hypothetical protein